MKRMIRILCAVSFFCLGCVACAQANIFLSTYNNATLGGLSFRDGDIVEYDPVTDTATLFFNEDVIGTPPASGAHSPNIDVFHILPNGNLVFSTTIRGNTLGAITYIYPGDLIEYNPTTGAASLFFDHSLFAGHVSGDIDAFSILNNGNLLISTDDYATLAGLSFEQDDLIEYNPTTGTASVFLNGSDVFAYPNEIDAVHALSNGNLILSTANGGIINGFHFEYDDMVEYNPTTGDVSLYFSGLLFDTTCSLIDAVYVTDSNNVVPEPSSVFLLTLGLLGAGVLRRHKS